ncbi:MAG: glutamate-cysteine ligase family protein [Spirochaetaceae bacterium]|nr:glutamate-cysteine ligase family protein [Spirochaetaceae bacterium]
MAKAGDDLQITLGVEEEFFLIDPDTRDLLADPDPDIFAACERNSGPHKVVPEFLRSQIETNTRICSTVTDVREALVETRALVLESAAAHGAAVIASSTHPFAERSRRPPARSATNGSPLSSRTPCGAC